MAKSERPQRTILHATVRADAKIFAALVELDIDFLPTRELLPNGGWAVEAIVELEQLPAILRAGATVELRTLIDPRFPQESIMSTEAAREPLRALERFREAED